MWNPFKTTKNIIEPVEKKSFKLPPGWLINGGGLTNNQLTINRALRFYDDAAPVATAIDWINDEFKTLSLLLQQGDDVTKDADILKFLKNPNDDMVQEDFLETLGAYFLICNEVYIVATGNAAKPPAELLVISPEHISVRKDPNGFLSQINIQRPVGTEIFKRADNQYRFFNKDMTAEIWQIKGFSASGDSLVSNSELSGNGSLTSSRGRSKLSSIHREINQYIEIATHNLSLLSNGMLPSGVLSVPEGATLDDDQFARIKDMVDNFYSGAKNAGKVLILDNGITFTPLSTNGKDMDFKELTRQVTMTVFNRYKVPLPLISPDNMTLANMDTAKLNLYDNCVIPMANRLLRELTSFLAPRFKLGENDVIVADLDSISALQPRRNDQLKIKKELNIYTINELRQDAGDDVIKEGGDIVYIANNLVPSGTDMTMQSNSLIDVTPVEKQINTIATRKQFIAIMQKQVDVKGNRTFDDKEINEIADSEGL